MAKDRIAGAAAAAALILLATCPVASFAQTKPMGPVNGSGSEYADAGGSVPAKSGFYALPDVTKQGIGCLGTAATALTYAAFAAGAGETLMVAAGGLTVASTSPTLFLGLTSTLVAGTCALGAAAEPPVEWAFEQSGNIIANVTYQAKAVGADVASFSNKVLAEVLPGGAFAGNQDGPRYQQLTSR